MTAAAQLASWRIALRRPSCGPGPDGMTAARCTASDRPNETPRRLRWFDTHLRRRRSRRRVCRRRAAKLRYRRLLPRLIARVAQSCATLALINAARHAQAPHHFAFCPPSLRQPMDRSLRSVESETILKVTAVMSERPGMTITPGNNYDSTPAATTQLPPGLNLSRPAASREARPGRFDIFRIEYECLGRDRNHGNGESNGH